MPALRRLLAALLLAAPLAGCSTGALQPMDPAPLFARTPLPTRGGFQLENDAAGNLLSRPLGDAFAAALGVELEEVEGELRVAAVHAGDARLREGDVLRALRAHPPGADLAPIASVTWDRAFAIRGRSDVEGYALARSTFDLLVERAGQPTTVRAAIPGPEPVPLRLWHPALTRALGFDATLVADLPTELRPTTARRPADLLVTYVAVESPLALLGLRPLDVIEAVGPLPELLLAEPHDVVHADGTRIEDLTFPEPLVPTDLDILFVLADLQSDPLRTALSIGPLGLLFQYASSSVYNPRTDRYAEATTWGVGRNLLLRSSLSGDGRHDTGKTSFGLTTGLPETQIASREGEPPFQFWPSARPAAPPRRRPPPEEGR